MIRLVRACITGAVFHPVTDVNRIRGRKLPSHGTALGRVSGAAPPMEFRGGGASWKWPVLREREAGVIVPAALLEVRVFKAFLKKNAGPGLKGSEGAETEQQDSN